MDGSSTSRKVRPPSLPYSFPPSSSYPSLAVFYTSPHPLPPSLPSSLPSSPPLDVEDECSKYGKIKHSAVDTRSPAGHVYMLFKEGEEEGKEGGRQGGRQGREGLL